ncbi:MAG: hypothetical protein CMD98_06555 [Gammaproteobacteria bacterium]|nr:hypothetical protein [Gammaproteobacteria bacterium]|tara:strand:- start:1267 stop:1497 length:231 start_codon:yes stop_codon:yes gene_type:complete
MSIDELIGNVKKGDVQSSNNSFNTLMADKINSALDGKRQEIAQGMYGEEVPVEEPADTEVAVEEPTAEETPSSEDV